MYHKGMFTPQMTQTLTMTVEHGDFSSAVTASGFNITEALDKIAQTGLWDAYGPTAVDYKARLYWALRVYGEADHGWAHYTVE